MSDEESNYSSYKKQMKEILADTMEEEIKKAKEEERGEKQDDQEEYDFELDAEASELENDTEEEEDEPEVEVQGVSPEQLIEKDFLEVRRNLKKIVKRGNSAVAKIVKGFQGKDQQPRQVQDLCELLKVLRETNKDILAVHEMKNRVINPGGAAPKSPEEGHVDSNGNLNIDSATLSKLAKKMKE